MSYIKFYNFNKKPKSFISGLLVFFIFIILTGCSNVDQDSQNKTNFFNDKNEKENENEEIDILLKEEKIIESFKWEKTPLAIMIENFKDARPVFGILKSNVVYETPVEANITRFLVIFKQSGLPDKIGPIRSARSYFLSWADEYGAIFIHAGGSPDALQSIKNKEYDIYNLDEISKNGNYFLRDYNQNRPHNLYIERDSINQFIKNKNITLDSYINGWKYKKFSINQNNNLLGILKIPYREDAVWKYDKDKNRYLRYERGKPLKDEKGNQLSAKNIVVQKTDIETIDEVGRKSIRTNGSGDVMIFQNGNIINGFWEKLKGDEQTKFYKKNGEEIIFSPGIVWVHIVSNKSNIDYY